MLKIAILCILTATVAASGVLAIDAVTATEIRNVTVTPAPIITTNATTVSVIPANTTTIKPNTSTTTITTTSIPNTTKPVPNNTTTVSPPTTTMPVPTPLPAPTEGKWSLNGTNTTCIILQLAAEFNVTYINKRNETVYKLYNLPANNTNATGNCSTPADQNQTISLYWSTWNASTPDCFLTIEFRKDLAAKSYYFEYVKLYLNSSLFPDIKNDSDIILTHKYHEFPTSLSHSYRCLKSNLLNLTNTENVTNSTLSLSQLRFQAFRTTKTVVFEDTEDCAFDTSDVVPIAVGCALAVLVLIVLVAYVIGRRRNQTRGYLSM